MRSQHGQHGLYPVQHAFVVPFAAATSLEVERIPGAFVTEFHAIPQPVASAPALLRIPESDDVLMQRVAQGDAEAFAALYARYTPPVTSILNRYLRQPALVEETLNDVMLVLWQQAEDFNATLSLSSWVYGIARHKALSVLRKSARLTEEVAHPPRVASPMPSDAKTGMSWARVSILVSVSKGFFCEGLSIILA